MNRLNLNSFIQKEAKKASRKLLIFVLVAIYSVFSLSVFYTYKYKAEAAVKSSSSTLAHATSLGDLNQIKRVIRSFISNDTCSAVWITQEKNAHLIDFYSKKFLSDNQDDFNYTLSFVENKLFIVNTDPIEINGRTIAKLKTAVELPVLIYFIGFLFLYVIYTFGMIFLQKEFGKVGEKISDPLKIFYTLLNKNLSELNQEKEIFNKSYIEIDEIYSQYLKVLHENYEKQKIEEEAKTSNAIAQMTQMFAHDVRKPFVMIKGILDRFTSISDSEKALNFAKRHTSEINQAISNVNGMILDIMEIGSETKIQAERVSLLSIIETSLIEVFRYKKDSKILFTYTIKHKNKVNADPLKLLRVFSNIVQNAAQAMNNQGKIWITTESVEIDNILFAKICIGNEKSYVPTEEQSSLFEVFYTKNKKGGTGLGLAIAKKIVILHGGNIWCESDKSRGTEFIFTIPISEELETLSAIYLPESSTSLYKNFDSLDDSSKTEDFDTLLSLENKIKEKNIKLSILIVDDEKIYFNLVENIIKNLKLEDRVKIKYCNTPNNAIDEIMHNQYQLVLMDINFEGIKENGLDAVKFIRNKGINSTVCIHTNYIDSSITKKANSIGANMVILKPISKEKLLNLIFTVGMLNVDENIASSSDFDDKYIIVVDDSIFNIELWESIKEVKKIGYLSPESFLIELDKKENLIEKAICIVTDYYFDETSNLDGLTFAKNLRERDISLPIFLSSSGDIDNENMKYVNGKISKDPIEAWESIKKQLSFHI